MRSLRVGGGDRVRHLLSKSFGWHCTAPARCHRSGVPLAELGKGPRARPPSEPPISRQVPLLRGYGWPAESVYPPRAPHAWRTRPQAALRVEMEGGGSTNVLRRRHRIPPRCADVTKVELRYSLTIHQARHPSGTGPPARKLWPLASATTLFRAAMPPCALSEQRRPTAGGPTEGCGSGISPPRRANPAGSSAWPRRIGSLERYQPAACAPRAPPERFWQTD